jgi:hypothetical protein
MLRPRRWIPVLLAAGLLAGCARTVYVPQAPPPRREETRPPWPGPGFVWKEGHWKWNGHAYAWVDGRWFEAGRHGGWEPGRWVKRQRGWVWLPGHWKD